MDNNNQMWNYLQNIVLSIGDIWNDVTDDDIATDTEFAVTLLLICA